MGESGKKLSRKFLSKQQKILERENEERKKIAQQEKGDLQRKINGLENKISNMEDGMQKAKLHRTKKHKETIGILNKEHKKAIWSLKKKVKELTACKIANRRKIDDLEDGIERIVEEKRRRHEAQERN